MFTLEHANAKYRQQYFAKRSSESQMSRILFHMVFPENFDFSFLEMIKFGFAMTTKTYEIIK